MRSALLTGSLGCAVMLNACTPSSPPSSVATPAPPPSASPKTDESVSAPHPSATGPSSSSSAPPPEPCGAFTCRRFPNAAPALLYVLEVDRPRALGVGESHALAGTEAIASATSRFAHELLPAIAERTSDLVVELVMPPSNCAPDTTQQVEREEREITQGQAASNQNQFVELGHRARAVGVVPYILHARCEDLDAIARAGDEGVLVLMETIARLTIREVDRLLARQPPGDERMVVAYGGALHNDVNPRPGRERWSYGPELAARTQGRYTAIDLIVPEHIQDTDSWRAFPWYDAVPPLTDDGCVLLELAPRSWVLFFPTNVPASAVGP